MADTFILNSVKAGMGITGTYQDATLNSYIEEVKSYMIGGGVPTVIANSKVSAGVITRGVTDLWNYGSGEGKFSEYFYQRVTQLCYDLNTGKIIYFYVGDYGNTYPVNIEGVEINTADKVIFKCGEFEKEYTDIKSNCILLTFTEEEAATYPEGCYDWTLKLVKDNSIVTLVGDGTLLVI